MQKFLVLVVLASLVACGDDDANTRSGHFTAAVSTDSTTPAALGATEWEHSEPGITPFISIVHLVGDRIGKIKSVSYLIEPKAGSVSKPVRVTYTLEALKNRGRLASDTRLLLPVFGLYAGFDNSVSIQLNFVDCSSETVAGVLTTAAYTDPNGVYDHPQVFKNRAEGSELGFDFFAVKSGLGTPVILDTDGEIRWVGVSSESSISSAFTENGFVIGDALSTKVRRLELDGTETSFVPPSNYRRFHHNIDAGKTGLLAEMDTVSDRESTIAEFSMDRGFYKQWDFANIVRDHMTAGGDDPSLFVRPGVDWFHTNATTYDERDDSLLVSSRENFILNADYETGSIRWVLGDPTKYWATFPSLRAKALTLTAGGLYPIGQHSLSLTSDGLLLTFNAGNASENQPAGAPRGEARTYSAVSAYRIDAAAMTATEVWHFDYGQSLYSDHCSSAYEADDHSLLISFARADNRLHARLVGLNAEHEVVFDFQYDSRGCGTAWNAVPVPLDDMAFS